MLKNFRVYQFAIQLARSADSVQMPAGLRDQWLRTTQSIALNIAEGAGKPHSAKEQRRFYRIAFGSVREAQACLDIADLAKSEIGLLADKIAAHLYKLIL